MNGAGLLIHFAGVSHLGGGAPSIQAARISRALQTLGGETRAETGAAHVLVRMGAGGEPSVEEHEAGSMAVAGDPLLTDRAPVSDALGALLQRFEDGGPFAGACGQFTAVAVAKDGVTVLVGDPLGIRPLYYTRVGDELLYSTSLEVLKTLHAPGEVDELGTWEALTFGHPLGNRTCYGSIHLVPPGNALRVSESGVDAITYWKLSDTDLSGASTEDLSREYDRRFRAAVRRRLSDQDEPGVAFLSGGMDSRSLVAVLHDTGKPVVTLNVAPSGTLDAELGRMAAEAIGTQHRHFDFADAARMLTWQRRAIAELRSEGVVPDRPRLPVWTGDGGSMLAGCLYLSEQLVETAEQGDWDATAQAVMVSTGNQLADGLVVSDRRAAAAKAVLTSVSDSIRHAEEYGGGEALYRFFLRGGQRRHLHRYFSGSGAEDYEPVLPFFDTEFVDFLTDVPIQEKLDHRLYHHWFVSGAIGAASDVPWQTYPGHVPCPLPMPTGLRYQWGRGAGWYTPSQRWRLAVAEAWKAGRFLGRAGAMRGYLNRSYASVALVSAALGVKRWSHVPKTLLSLAEN